MKLAVLNAALLGSVLIAPGAASALPTCAELGSNPAYGLAGNPAVADLAVDLIPASGSNLARCELIFTDVGTPVAGPAGGYMEGQTATIGIRVGLPLSQADGGSGSVQGAWNGKVKSLGNGGFAGAITQTTNSTNTGYVGTGSDTGHTGNNASFGLNPDGTVNLGRIADYGYRGQRRANQWGRVLAKTYYGLTPTHNYWQGCSDGGREGHEMAQKYGDEFDGILAISPAIAWERWGYAAAWPAIVWNEELGAPLTPAKWNAVNAAAVAACDGIDGVVDGMLEDTRRCNYDANAFVCTGGSGDPAECLTPAEAAFVNKSWDGPRNAKGKKVWYGWERGTMTANSTTVTTPSRHGEEIMRYWVHKDPTFDWKTVNQAEYIEEMNQAQIQFQKYIGSDNPILNQFRDGGGKMIATYGNSDQTIPPRGHYYYYNRVASVMGGIAATQDFYRYFVFPGARHCSGSGMDTNQLFDILVNWVENGVAPAHVVAQVNPTRTRKACMYPNTQVYNGSGSTDDHNNFHCQVNAADDPALLAADQLTKLFHAHD